MSKRPYKPYRIIGAYDSETTNLSSGVDKRAFPILHQLGRHSYFAYLAHPVAITYLSLFLQHHGILMTAPAAILFYAATLFLAMLGAVIFRNLGQRFHWINILTIGVYPKK